MTGYKTGYLQVDHDFKELIIERIESGKSGRIHFFNPYGQVDDCHGNIIKLLKNEDGEYLKMDTKVEIRLDQIITLYGMPGPAYDLYESFGNACLSCTDMGQFY